MKVNLLAECELLVRRLELLSTSQAQLGQKAQTSLAQVAKASKALLHLMQQLNESYVDLTAFEITDSQRSEIRQVWEALPAGRLQESQINALVRNKSTTLNRLYRASVDFRGITKFSEQELSFAREIGDSFKTHKRFWTRLKKILGDSRLFHVVHEREVRGVLEFFRILKKHGVVPAFEIRLKREGREPEVLSETAIVAELRKQGLTDVDRLSIAYELDKQHHMLLTGGWFEAYSYHVFSDMLTRLSADFEIYSRVQYEATQAARGASRGDIDLLVSVDDQIIMVECKSGDVTEEEAARVDQKTRFLREIFESMGVSNVLFMLVASPSEIDEAGPLTRLRDKGIEIVEPQDIRTFLSQRLKASS